MVNGKICRRDGEQACLIEFHGVRVELGITELQALVRCALMDLGNASPAVRRALEKPLKLISEMIDVATSIELPPNLEDMEKNRQRWQETGLGGVTDLSEMEASLEYWRSQMKRHGVFTTLEQFRKIQEEANGSLEIPCKQL